MPSEPDESAEEAVERFVPTGGRVTGVVGLVMAAGVIVLWLVDPDSVPAAVAAGALLGGVLVWASLLRPRVSASRETLFLRNMLETIHIPLAAVDELVVRQVLTVRVGEKKYVCPAVGRKLRKVMRGAAARAAPGSGRAGRPARTTSARRPSPSAPLPTSTTRTTWRTGCATWSRRPGSGTASAGTPTRPRRWPATYAACRRGRRSRRWC